jgi:hypothetical protein
MRHRRSAFWTALAIGTVYSFLAGAAEPQTSSVASSISYATLEEALKDLRAKPGITFRKQNGWLVAEDAAAFTVWLLTPGGHPAYPSMVKRTLVNSSDGAHFETNVRCLASQVVCDKYFGN